MSALMLTSRHFQSRRINAKDVTLLLYAACNNWRVKRSGESHDTAYSLESFSTRSGDRNIYFRGPAKPQRNSGRARAIRNRRNTYIQLRFFLVYSSRLLFVVSIIFVILILDIYRDYTLLKALKESRNRARRSWAENLEARMEHSLYRSIIFILPDWCHVYNLEFRFYPFLILRIVDLM